MNTDPAMPLPDAPHTAGRDTRRAVWLCVGLFVLYVIVSSGSTLWDRDEPRFARATTEMVQSGNWLYPTFNGKLRPDKPILIYWLQALPMLVLGPTAAAARLPSNAGLALACWITFLIGRRMFDARAGLWAALAMGTSIMAMMVGSVTAATADGTLIWTMTLAVYAFVEMVYAGSAVRSSLLLREGRDDGRRGIDTNQAGERSTPSPGLATPESSAPLSQGHREWMHMLLMGLALGLAALTKGPVGLAVPLLTVLGVWWLGRSEKLVTRRHWGMTLLAALIGIAVFIAWALPANIATGGEFASRGLGHHVVNRVMTPQEGHGGSGWKYVALLPLYVPVLLIGLLPWTGLAIEAFMKLWRRQMFDARQRAVILGWCVPTFIMMSLVATKLPHYIFPIWPALCVMIGGMLARQGRTKQPAWVGSGMAGLMVLAGLVVLPVVERYKPSPRLAQQVEAALALPSDSAARRAALGEVRVCGSNEPSFQFYLNHTPIEPIKAQDVRQWAAESGPGLLVITDDMLEIAEGTGGPLPLKKLGEAQGYNYSKRGKRSTLLALRREGRSMEPRMNTDEVK